MGENWVKTIQDIVLLILSLHMNLQLSPQNVKKTRTKTKKPHRIKKHLRGMLVVQFASEF